jgi:hypothetical protein
MNTDYEAGASLASGQKLRHLRARRMFIDRLV